MRALVAWLRLGSLTDQVSSARVRLTTPKSATRPAISAARRFGNSRTETGIWSITENVVVRIAHLPKAKQRDPAPPPRLTLGTRSECGPNLNGQSPPEPRRCKGRGQKKGRPEGRPR